MDNNPVEIDFRLDGQIGMVTGAANGIGSVLAVGLAAAGADIVVADLPSQHQAAEATAEQVRQRGRQALVLNLDVTDVASIEAAVSTTVKTFGRMDFLVNNAGVNTRKPVLEYSEADWDRIASVNLKGTFFCSQIAGRQMVAQNCGRIVNIASQLAEVAMEQRSIYAITKAGVAHMARAFAVELGPFGVTVNAVGPTFVSTAFTTSMFQDPEFISQNLPKIPCRRFGTPTDVLAAVQYLLSPAANLVNGHLLLVDGGYTIG